MARTQRLPNRPAVTNSRFRRFVRAVAGVWVVLAAAGLHAAQGLEGILDAAAAATATSRSHQIIVHGRPPPAAKLGIVRNATEANPIVELQPQALVITAERVQAALLTRLDASTAGGRGRFHLFLIPTNRFGAGPLEIIPRPFREGWQFHVGLPESVDWRRLVRGLSEVVILELANRGSVASLARPPLWVNEGLAGILEIEEGRSLLQEPEVAVVRAGRRGDPLVEARAALVSVVPMTFSELCQPSTSLLSDTNQFARFQASAILLVEQLLREDGGAARLRQAVVLSPQYLNWEFAFLKAFEGRFVNALDIEKWWAVNSQAALARDPFRRWTRGQTLARLREVLNESTSTQAEATAPAIRRQIPVRQLIQEIDFPAQQPVLERKLAQLREIYRQAPDELLEWVQEYYRTLENYLNRRQSAGQDPTGRGELAVRSRLLLRQTVGRLAGLDRRLEDMR